jgi:hypothetical protein
MNTHVLQGHILGTNYYLSRENNLKILKDHAEERSINKRGDILGMKWR